MTGLAHQLLEGEEGSSILLDRHLSPEEAREMSLFINLLRRSGGVVEIDTNPMYPGVISINVRQAEEESCRELVQRFGFHQYLREPGRYSRKARGAQGDPARISLYFYNRDVTRFLDTINP